MDLGAAEDKGDLHCLIFNRLKRPSDINAQLTKLLNAAVVNEIHVFLLAAVENDAHDCLPGSDWAVCLDMHFVNTDCLPLVHKSIENVLAKVFSFNDYFLLFGMLLLVIGGQGVDTIRLFADSRSDRSWVETEHASASNHADLWPLRHQDSESFLLESVLDMSFQVGTLRESTHHEDEVHWAARLLSL